jgi:HTH-type transcriptional regulator/antitoxin MqsA
MIYNRRRLRNQQRCPRCDSEAVKVISEPAEAATRDGTLVTFADEFSRCSECGNEFYAKSQSLAHSRALASAVRQVEGFYTPEAIRAIRLKFGLSQADFERAIRAGPKTAVRWERGTVTQSRAVDGLLWIADHHPAVFERLAERNGVKIQPRDGVFTVSVSVSGVIDSGTFSEASGGRIAAAGVRQPGSAMLSGVLAEQVA